MKKISYLDIVKTLLSEKEFSAFTQRYNKPLQKSIKILKSKTEFSAFQEQIAKDGRTLKTPKFSRKGKKYDDVLFVEKTDKQSLGKHHLHQKGYFYVQEMAAGLAAQVLNIQPGDIVLDLCAAPGGKSIQLADKLLLSTAPGLLISNEPSPNRRKALKANLERCGIWNAIITGYEGKTLGNLLSEQCDKVLLDAPCSGEGMQYKSDVNIYQRKEKATRKLAHLQKNLLITGINALKKGGELVYSTCTTNTIENEEVILSILQELKGQIELLEVKIEEKSPGIVKIESNKTSPTDHNTLPSNIVHNITTKVARFRPHIHHTGGFFIAKFKKIKTNTSTYKTSQKKDQILLHNTAKQMRDPSIKKSNKTTRDYSKSLQKKVQSYLSSYFPQENITSHFLQNNKIHGEILFIQTKFTIRAVTKSALPFLETLFIEQTGLPIIKILNNGTRKPLI